MPLDRNFAASLTSFDWALIVLVVLSTIAAFLRGIIRVLFSLAGLIVGILVASWNYASLSTQIHRWIGSFETAQVFSFLLILVLVTIVFSVVARLLRRAVSAIGLGFLDRLFGAAFGFVRGLLLGVAAMMLIAAFLPANSWIKNSQLAPYFLAGAHALSFVVPQHFQKQIAAGATQLLQHTPDFFWHDPFPNLR